jgi:hypothetical protein
MSSKTDWADRQRRIGWALVATGGVVCAAGVALQTVSPGLPFDPRVVTGLGILLLGLAAAALMRGGVGTRGRDATRLGVEEQDERNLAIRRLSGSRAFGVSAALTFALLMWVSISANGQLPAFSADGLWFALVAAFVLPVLVYAGSAVHAQRSM